MRSINKRRRFWISSFAASLLYGVWHAPSAGGLLAVLGYIVCAVYGERGRLPRRYGVGFPLEIAAFSSAAAYIADASARQFVFALLGSLAFTVLWVLLVNEGGRK